MINNLQQVFFKSVYIITDCHRGYKGPSGFCSEMLGETKPEVNHKHEMQNILTNVLTSTLALVTASPMLYTLPSPP